MKQPSQAKLMRGTTTFLILFSILFFIFLKNAYSIEIKKEMGLGIRGNGESVSAHWGGLARLVEEYGAFGTVSGGSSASLTLFFYESALLNPYLSCTTEELVQNPACEKEKLAFMIKSFEGMVDAIPETIDAFDLKGLYQQISMVKKELDQIYCQTSTLNALPDIFKFTKTLKQLIEISYEKSNNQLLREIPNWELLQALQKETSNLFFKSPLTQMNKVKNLINHLKKAYDVFGKFDSKNDDGLFVRPGLINFKNFGSLTARMANFIAARGLDLDPSLAQKYQIYINSCSKNTKGKEWKEIKEQKIILVEGDATNETTCEEYLSDLFSSYSLFFKNHQGQIKSRENDLPGESLENFNPILSTSVSFDTETIDSWKKAYDQFIQGEDKEKWNWQPDFNKISYGYWVKKSEHENLKQNIAKICAEKNDFVLCKAHLIGAHSWKTILALSPAEPGLSRVQHLSEVLPFDPNISDEEKTLNLISLGGWSDLMPQKIIQAAGTNSQTIITRRGYHTYFGQGVMIRLGMNGITHDEIAYLHQKDNAKNPLSDDFEHASNEFHPNPKKRTTGQWAQGYNIHNPNSSFNQALTDASAVLCTNWDSGDVKGWKDLITDSYNSIFYVKDVTTFPQPQTATFTPVKEGEVQADLQIGSGAKYVVVDTNEEGQGFLHPSHQWFNRGCTGITQYSKDLPLYSSPVYPNSSSLKSAEFPDEI